MVSRISSGGLVGFALAFASTWPGYCAYERLAGKIALHALLPRRQSSQCIYACRRRAPKFINLKLLVCTITCLSLLWSDAFVKICTSVQTTPVHPEPRMKNTRGRPFPSRFVFLPLSVCSLESCPSQQHSISSVQKVVSNIGPVKASIEQHQSLVACTTCCVMRVCVA